MTQDTERTQFDYLLNAFDDASQSNEPVHQGYRDKRRALYAYVRDLERRATPPEGSAGDVQALSCAWHEDEDGLWQMACGGDPWLFEDGGVVENRVKFCMHCGKPVVLAAKPPEDRAPVGDCISQGVWHAIPVRAPAEGEGL